MALIEREAAIAKVEPDEYYHSNEVKAMLEDVPAIEAAPVIRGRWIECDDDIYTWIECSKCGFEQDIDDCGEHPHEAGDYMLCPACGARMDGSET